ncbi:uncharacterized protein EI90DRAFT_243511 [Cantharellus anzutake]|uniref:uncharacterized protein n=1 Tax=Cantharellus anzutake TaxID=1750568 RepID=UPI001903AAEC|nr:uncharacterized protein EI90DRAFT_243511 [Cantharellus anzutake]KAF8335689.1 hypothetical protein EI90DRAFT_243511 [Cantharellus anzutake]
MGKSRLVDEFSRTNVAIPMNLRSYGTTGKSPFDSRLELQDFNGRLAEKVVRKAEELMKVVEDVLKKAGFRKGARTTRCDSGNANGSPVSPEQAGRQICGPKPHRPPSFLFLHHLFYPWLLHHVPTRSTCSPFR